MKRITVGIFAHVDAGKTTCIEGLLYQAGITKKLGRVDHRDAVLDYDQEERKHGITIYSKEAFFTWKDSEIYVIDTPGHVDFSSEVARCLRIVDVAILLINGQDGVQSHTETIWKYLAQYHIPTIIFVNKMDITHRSKEELYQDLIMHCSHSIVDFSNEERDENIALLADELLEEYEQTQTVSKQSLKQAIQKRIVFPCLFGSCLKVEGLDELLDLLALLSESTTSEEPFSALAYKISQDTQGNRLTHVKITGGKLHVKDKINEEKVDQIRIYTGEDYQVVNEVEKGMVCALKGLKETDGLSVLGKEIEKEPLAVNALMRYRIAYPKNADQRKLVEVINELGKEDPTLDVTRDEHTGEIYVSILGEMQIEILQNKILERSGIEVTFDQGRILYQETILDEVIGVGHFEPLRHYAEVVVKLTPLPQGSGIKIVNACQSDTLSQAYQKAIMNHLSQKKHRGVLMGMPLTDVEISLLDGKGHVKHTEGGDFREASVRAVRQGLMKANSILLEPYYAFRLELSQDYVSQALYDLERKHADFEMNQDDNHNATIVGKGPARLFMHYQNEVMVYTKGTGRFSYESAGYFPVENQEELLENSTYDPQRDRRNPVDSVFCAHGSSVIVPWYEVEEHMHVLLKTNNTEDTVIQKQIEEIDEEELKRVFEMTFGRNRKMEKRQAQTTKKELPEKVTIEKQLPQCLLVDGYNMIFAWEDLKEVAKDSIEIARNQLIEKLHHYQSYTNAKVIVVFDGYKVKHQSENIQTDGLFSIVYTRTNETADIYIEKKAHELKNQYRLVVATSDALIQNAVFSQGALRMSARELEKQIQLLYKIFL